ncbi:MAG: hypothetical protein ACQETE_13525 [Bacteroidota bacterium]
MCRDFYQELLIFLIVGAVYTGCEQPLDNFNRSNKHDPGSTIYVIQGPDTVYTDFYSGNLIRVKWVDYSFIQEEYIIERSDDDGPFTAIDKINVKVPHSKNDYLDTVRIHGDIRYRVKGVYSSKTIISEPTNSVRVKNWLPIISDDQAGGEIISFGDNQVLSFRMDSIAIFSSDEVNWKKIDRSFCSDKLTEVQKSSEGALVVLCANNDLKENEIGLFVMDPTDYSWEMAYKIERGDNVNYQNIIPISSNRYMIIGFSGLYNREYLAALLIDLQSGKSVHVNYYPEDYGTYIELHDSSPLPNGLQITNNKLFVSCSLDGDNAYQKSLIFNIDELSWEPINGPPSGEVSDVNMLCDGKIITVDGAGSFFEGGVYDIQLDEWNMFSHTSGSGFAKKLLKLSNGRVISIDSGGNVLLFDEETSTWKNLSSEHPNGFNLQYRSATLYGNNKIMIHTPYSYRGNYYKTYRPSPKESHYFE